MQNIELFRGAQMKLILQRRTRLDVRLVALSLILAIQLPLLAQDAVPAEDLFEMDIEELLFLDIDVSVASKKAESLIEAPGVVVVVPREESELYGDRNLHQLMQRQPSVYTRNSFVYSDNLAAFRGNMPTHAEMHTLILFNGRPIRESAQGHNVNMYLTLPLAHLESVELIRGPGSVLYGSNAFTGVVNLKSRPIPEQYKVSVSSMAGSYGYYDTTVSLGGRSGDLGFVADVRVAGQQGPPYNITDALGVYGEDDKQDKSYSGAVHLDYQGFTLDFFGSDLDAFTLGVLPFWSNPNRTIRNKKMFLNTGYRVPVHDRATLELNVTYNLQENSLSSPDSAMVGTNTSDVLGEATLYADPIDNLNVVLGYLQEYRSNYDPGDDKYQSIPSYRHEPKSFYAQGDYKFDKFLKLIAGTQWNDSSYGIDDWISRYGLIITPFDKWGLKLLRGEAFRAPVTLETDLYDPRGLVGNKNLEPETITTYDAQLFYHDEKTYAAVTYFQSTIDKLIIYDASVTPMSYMNGGQQKFDGIEFEVKRSLTPHWHIIGSFMHQENETDAGLDPTVVPDNMAKFGTAYTWDWGSISLFYCFFDEPPEIYYASLPAPFGSTLVANPEPKELNLISLNVRIDVSKWVGLDKGQSIFTLRAENLLDEEIYVPTFAYKGSPNSFPYGPGRTFFAGLTVNF
jgi:outer membrane receptor for ferrienterochelin and colicins